MSDRPAGPGQEGENYPPHRGQAVPPRRNDALVDGWSAVHVVTGIAMGWVMDPFLALLIMIAWEPLELFVLYPLSMRLFGIPFGYESWRNSFSDIVFDAAGVALGFFVLGALVDPPFTLF